MLDTHTGGAQEVRKRWMRWVSRPPKKIIKTYRGRNRGPPPGTAARPSYRRQLREAEGEALPAWARPVPTYPTPPPRRHHTPLPPRFSPCSSSLEDPELPSSQELPLLLPLGAADKLLLPPLLLLFAPAALWFLPRRFPETSGPFSIMAGI